MSAPCPVFGFVVSMSLGDLVSDAFRDALVDSLIEVVERHDMMAAGGGDRALEFVVSREGSQATSADRDVVRAWASEWTDHATIRVGDLVDLSQDA